MKLDFVQHEMILVAGTHNDVYTVSVTIHAHKNLKGNSNFLLAYSIRTDRATVTSVISFFITSQLQSWTKLLRHMGDHM